MKTSEMADAPLSISVAREWARTIAHARGRAHELQSSGRVARRIERSGAQRPRNQLRERVNHASFDRDGKRPRDTG